MTDLLLWEDAPIRSNFQEGSLCATCTKVLQFCTAVNNKKSMNNGYWTVYDCDEYQDYREPPEPSE